MFTSVVNMKDVIEKKIDVPTEVTVTIDARTIHVKGPKGTIIKKFSDPRYDSYIKLKKEDHTIIVTSSSERKKVKALLGTMASGIQKMIIGVTSGYTYTMKIFFVHFPMNITVKDNTIQIKNFLGEKTLRTAQIHGNVHVKIDKDIVTVTGVNKEEVGQTCGNIEKAVKITKKDRRIFQDGIFMNTKSVGM